VRQHVTEPDRPHVERDTQLWTAFRQSGDIPLRLITCLAHFSYAPWLVAVAQSHCAAICARSAATPSSSPGDCPHRFSAVA